MTLSHMSTSMVEARLVLFDGRIIEISETISRYSECKVWFIPASKNLVTKRHSTLLMGMILIFILLPKPASASMPVSAPIGTIMPSALILFRFSCERYAVSLAILFILRLSVVIEVTFPSAERSIVIKSS